MENKKISKGARNVVKAVALSAVSAGLRTGGILAAKGIYDSCFPRYERKDPSLIYGEFVFSRVQDRLKRVTFNFLSENIPLQGYYYPCSGAKGMVVVCHGMHSGADDYIPFIEYFVNNGFAVFAYDCRGTYSSEGDSTVGMLRPVVDLDHALSYIKTDKSLSRLPLFLFGHSWGGYAVCSVLSLHKGIRACCAVAPFNDGYTLIEEKGEQYAGPFSDVVKQGFPKKFLDAYQSILFGKYTSLNAVKGINSTDIPVYIAHGRGDKVISFSGQSVISHKSEIRTDNVVYYVGTGAHSGHNTILHSVRAVEYQELVKNELKRMKKEKDRSLTEEELASFSSGVDHALYSEVNTQMMDEIVNLFEKSL